MVRLIARYADGTEEAVVINGAWAFDESTGSLIGDSALTVGTDAFGHIWAQQVPNLVRNNVVSVVQAKDAPAP